MIEDVEKDDLNADSDEVEAPFQMRDLSEPIQNSQSESPMSWANRNHPIRSPISAVNRDHQMTSPMSMANRDHPITSPMSTVNRDHQIRSPMSGPGTIKNANSYPIIVTPKKTPRLKTFQIKSSSSSQTSSASTSSASESSASTSASTKRLRDEETKSPEGDNVQLNECEPRYLF